MNLLEKLAAKAERVAIDKAFAKGLMRCPKCGQKPDKAPADIETLMRCGSCGNESLPAGWRPDSQTIPTAHPDQMPAGTRIRREGCAPAECVWHIPASGRFGTTLRDEEKAWLVADIKRAVFGDVPASSSVAASSPEMIAAQRQSSFSFPLPTGPKGHWMLGVMFVLIGLGAIGMGLFGGSDMPGSGKDGMDWFLVVFDAIFSLFSLIPIFVGLVFSGIGVLIVRSTWSGQTGEVRLEGDEIQVALRTYQHGRVIKEEAFPRSSVGGVRATGSGHMNGKPMKRIDMIVDGKAKRITMWTAGDVADAWAADVTRALG